MIFSKLFRSLSTAITLVTFFYFTGIIQAAEKYDDGDELPSDLPGFSIGMLKKFQNSLETSFEYRTPAPLNNPKFLSVSDASLSMDNNEVVFIVEYPEGIIRIYPQRILVWHEVVNDTLPAPKSEEAYGAALPSPSKYTITYSPFSGTVVAFKSAAGRFPSGFASTGDQINANTVLYDNISNSLWSQLLGASFDGPLIGKRLERIPVIWATWKGAKSVYKGRAEVLSRSTGFKVQYGKDPYGSYQRKGTYYDDARILTRMSKLDTRLHPKTHILGIESDDLYGALQREAVRTEKILNFFLGVTPMVALYDESIDAIRVFDRRLNPKSIDPPLEFSTFENKLTDTATRSQWTPQGRCTYGKYRDQQLTPILAIDAMWMSWSTFHSGSLIIPENNVRRIR